MAHTWTPEQQNVIDFRDRDILVSAAAGSGKTAVLVERIIGRVTDPKDPIEIDSLLVVTFTKAAAAEMRERIGEALERACDADPGNSHLRRQSALIHNAMITTIDSFCLFVVRNHFEEIDLDPNFRIADEGEIRLLELDTLTEVFERNYASEENEAFCRLIDAYAGKRNDQAVKDMVAKIYRMSLSSPWPREWIAGLRKPYQVKTREELLDAELIADIADTTVRILKDIAAQLKGLHALALAADGPAAYAAALEADLEMISGAEEIKDFEGLLAFFQKIQFVRLSPLRQFTGDALKKEAVQNGRGAVKKELEELKEKYFSMDIPALLAQLGRIRPFVEELVRLALEYEEAMAAAKRKKRIVDFSDIEHFALRILVDEETKSCKRTAEEFRAHFAEIMIDEYQDSNQVQEEILRAISREEEGQHNMFMVGDVKQSIYRFRLARPELFMEKYASFDTVESERQRIDLHRNFRSRREVIDFCNDIFYKLMSVDLGRVAYDADAALYCGASYPECAGMEAELLLLDEADELLAEHAASDQNKRQLEARMVAARIKRLMRETMVTDKGAEKDAKVLRPLRYSDIVILFRSLKDWGTEFAQVLEGLGIPAHVESATGYFSAVEVVTVLNMLRILDNPYQDIPMAAVLKSPMAGLDEEELAEIRLRDPSMPFSANALHAMQEATEGELAHFGEVYASLRARRDVPIHELIQRILDETGYGSYAAAMPAGEQRRANLSMLIEKAIAYEKTSYRGLFHFVRYIDQLQKYEIDFGEADVTSEDADVVHIMTIHKSKGLEFPVVFVSGMGKHINQMDTNDRLVVHPELGIGLSEIETCAVSRIKRSCLYKATLAERIRRENLGEELRVLYVAMTRAKEKLILTGVVKDMEKMLGKYTGNVNEKQPISYRERAKAAGYLDWVLPAMLSYPDKYDISAVSPAELVWDEIKAVAQQQTDYAQLVAEISAADEELVMQYAEGFAYQYPYHSEVGKKSKYSVSELKHESMLRQFDQTENDAAVPDFLKEDREPYIPDFARWAASGSTSREMDAHGNALRVEVENESALYKADLYEDALRAEAENEKTSYAADLHGNSQEKEAAQAGVSRGALRGTAVHRVMECMDFAHLAELDRTDEAAVSAFVKEELLRMRESGELSQELYELIIPAVIERFASSGTALRMAKAAVRGELFREKPFVMQKDDVLVQGIIDVFWLEGDAIVLLDYKTDRVRTAQELIMRYELQLQLYADALGRIFSTETRQVKAEECLIYSFCLQEVIRI